MLAEAGLPANDVEYALAPGHLHLLREDVRLEVPTVAFSTRGFLRRGSRRWRPGRFAASRRQPILRVSVHPEDLYEHRVRRALVSVLQRALADREPVTCGELARAAVPSHV